MDDIRKPISYAELKKRRILGDPSSYKRYFSPDQSPIPDNDVTSTWELNVPEISEEDVQGTDHAVQLLKDMEQAKIEQERIDRQAPQGMGDLRVKEAIAEGKGPGILAMLEHPKAPRLGMGDSLRARAEVPKQPERRIAGQQPKGLPTKASSSTSDEPRDPYSSLERLFAAQEAGNNSKAFTNFARIGQGLNEAINKAKFDRSAFDSLDKSADDGVKQYQQEESAKAADMELDSKMEMQDPNSELSVTTRNLLKQMNLPVSDDTSAAQLQAMGVNIGSLLGVRETAAARKEAAIANRLAQEDRVRTKAEEALTKKTMEFSNRMDKGGLAELGGVINNVQATLPLDDAGKDVAGYGATGFLPDFLVTKAGKDNRQAVASLRNILLKARSGGAVTPEEEARYLGELGEGSSKSDDQLRQGIKNTINFLKSKQQNIAAGFTPAVIQQYKNQGGQLPFAQDQLRAPLAMNAPAAPGQTPPPANEEMRFDPRTGKTAVFDRKTKQFIRFQ